MTICHVYQFSFIHFIALSRFEDIFNIPEFREQIGQPHAVVENHLGIL